MTTALRSPVGTISAFKRDFRHDHSREHALLLDVLGRKIVLRTGDNDSVEFSASELEQGCGGVLIHTHPHGKPFSGEDLALAAQYGLTICAVGDTPDGYAYEYTYRLPYKYQSEFKTAQTEARNAQKGLWSSNICNN